jgi:hypothetical protein
LQGFFAVVFLLSFFAHKQKNTLPLQSGGFVSHRAKPFFLSLQKNNRDFVAASVFNGVIAFCAEKVGLRLSPAEAGADDDWRFPADTGVSFPRNELRRAAQKGQKQEPPPSPDTDSDAYFRRSSGADSGMALRRQRVRTALLLNRGQSPRRATRGMTIATLSAGTHGGAAGSQHGSLFDGLRNSVAKDAWGAELMKSMSRSMAVGALGRPTRGFGRAVGVR